MRMHPTDPAIPYPSSVVSETPYIEPGIAPLCDAINHIPGVHTLWSCEGHPRDGTRPYVVFEAPHDFSFALHQQLSGANAFRKTLRFNWRIMANFQESGRLQWILEIDDVRIRPPNLVGVLIGRNHWSRAQADADIIKIANLCTRLSYVIAQRNVKEN
jgi:hypothetical protein